MLVFAIYWLILYNCTQNGRSTQSCPLVYSVLAECCHKTFTYAVFARPPIFKITVFLSDKIIEKSVILHILLCLHNYYLPDNPGFEWKNGHPKGIGGRFFPICPCFERFRTGIRVEKRTSEREGGRFFPICSCFERFRTGIRVEKRTSEGCRRPIFSDLPLFLSASEHVIFCFLRVVFLKCSSKPYIVPDDGRAYAFSWRKSGVLAGARRLFARICML